MDVIRISYLLFAAEVHVDHRAFQATTVDLSESGGDHTLSSLFNHDFVEWGGTYFETGGIASGIGTPIGTLFGAPFGKLVIDVKKQMLLRSEKLTLSMVRMGQAEWDDIKILGYVECPSVVMSVGVCVGH